MRVIVTEREQKMNSELQSHEVLVLSSAWEPLYRSDWMRAMTDVISGKAEVIQYHDVLHIRSASASWKLPRTIRMLTGYVRAKQSKNLPLLGMRLTKRNLWVRDEGKCQYCNVELTAQTVTIDHVMPKSRGGEHSWENLVLACGACNVRKGSRTPGEASMPLSRKPTRPKPFNLATAWKEEEF
jgi:5-methylcytosine-specific restriction endonuclease McrA